METRAKAFFKEADKKFNLAKEESFKPIEDLVTFSVCKNSQFAIENYLKGFLAKNDVKIDMTETIDSLYKKCIGIDNNFKNINFSVIACKNKEISSRYCSEINAVNTCFDVADAIDTYLKKIKAI